MARLGMTPGFKHVDSMNQTKMFIRVASKYYNNSQNASDGIRSCILFHRSSMRLSNQCMKMLFHTQNSSSVYTKW